MSVIAGRSKGRRREGAYGDEAHREGLFPRTEEEARGGSGGPAGPCCLRRPDRSLPSSQRGALLSVGSKDSQSGRSAGFRAWAAPQMSEKEALDAYGKLPLSFIPNEGQTDEAVRYYAQGAGYGFFFTKEGATLSFADGKGRGHALALDFLGADPDATLTAQKRLAGKVNYLVGDDPAKWQQGLPTHAELLYGGLWPGIDMAVRGEGGKLKYEFHLKPGASVEDVRLGYRGAEGLKVGAGGELLVQTSLGVLKDAAPVSYQRIGGERVPVKSRYKLTGDGGYGFCGGGIRPSLPADHRPRARLLHLPWGSE